MSPAIVICVEQDSYISAVVALQLMIDRLPAKEGAPYVEALADFRRAHAMYLAVDAQIITPALLRRQI